MTFFQPSIVIEIGLINNILKTMWKDTLLQSIVAINIYVINKTTLD